jgi:hypothetical protein
MLFSSLLLLLLCLLLYMLRVSVIYIVIYCVNYVICMAGMRVRERAELRILPPYSEWEGVYGPCP